MSERQHEKLTECVRVRVGYNEKQMIDAASERKKVTSAELIRTAVRDYLSNDEDGGDQAKDLD